MSSHILLHVAHPPAPVPPCLLLTRLYPDILLMIFNLCSLPTLARLRASCREADEIISEEMERRYKRELSRFISNISLYRLYLDATGSVWSGSAALSSVANGRMAVGDLDIYLNLAARELMLDFLCNGEGYKHVGTQHPFTPGYSGGIEEVMTLRRQTNTIDLVFSTSPSALLPIAYFWSTPVMTFFTGFSVCIPYPIHVEKRIGLVNPGRVTGLAPSPLMDALAAKYKERGFDIREDEVAFGPQYNLPCRGTRSPTCPLTFRFFGDHFCLLSRLEVIAERLQLPALPIGLRTYPTLWQRGGGGCPSDCNQNGLVSFNASTLTF